jgi:putative holliday junction resolvase
MGLPLNMDGSPGPSAHSAREMGQKIAALTHKPVLYVDERLSTFAAEQNLKDRRRAGEKITRAQKKSRLDAKAAALFLQDFLDNKLPPQL